MATTVLPNPLDAAQVQWATFWKTIPPESLHAAFLYSEATGLLHDAIVSFHAGAIGAAAVTSRATIEAAGYSARWSTRIATAGWKYVFPLKGPRKIRRVEYEEVKREIAKLGVLPGKVLKQMDRVQKDGNFVAHLASKRAGELFRVARLAPKQAAPMRIWVTRSEAAADIECAETVLRTLMAWSCGQPIQPLKRS